MLYNIKYKEDLIFFIKKEIRKNFAEISIILDNRDIARNKGRGRERQQL
jgi:hypothetical protein